MKITDIRTKLYAFELARPIGDANFPEGRSRGMGLLDSLRNLFSGPDTGYDVEELARRLGMSVEALRAVRVAYDEFDVPKRSGGTRRISAPSDELKTLQRRILRKLLARLSAHPSATGFERGHSIVTNARHHAGQAVVVRMDLKDFFPSTHAARVREYFP